MLETKHHWLPVVLAGLMIFTFLVSYCIAVGSNHVGLIFPYISDTGTIPPESCVFGQLLNIGAVLAGAIIYIRYRHLLAHFQNASAAQSLLKLNTAAFLLGMITSFGVSIVGNVQVTNVLAVHLVGAFLAFAVGFVYCVLQTVISFKSASIANENCSINDIPGNSIFWRRIRTTLCILHLVFLILLLVAFPISKAKGPGLGVSKLFWKVSDLGFDEHILATVSEWMVALVIVLYLATFYFEFKHFRVKPPIVEYYTSNSNDIMTEMDTVTLNLEKHGETDQNFNDYHACGNAKPCVH